MDGPDGKTAYPICILPENESTCKESELFNSTGWWGKKMGRKFTATTEREAIEKYEFLEKQKENPDLSPVIAIFENEQWHITKILKNYDEEIPDGITAYPICKVNSLFQTKCFDERTTGLGRLWNSSKLSSAKTKKEVLDKMNKRSGTSDKFDAMLFNGKWRVSIKDLSNHDYYNSNVIKKYNSIAQTVTQDPEKQKSYSECLRRLHSNASINSTTKEKICNIISNVTGSSDFSTVGFSQAEIENNDKEDINNLLELWFNDLNVIGEIYKILAEKGLLCILESIVLNFDENVTTLKEISTLVQQKTRVLFDKGVYIEQILSCIDKPMAIPIYLQFENSPTGHANMLLINLRKNKVFEVEHFEPHGDFFDRGDSRQQSTIINDSIDYFIDKLFEPLKKNYTVSIIHPQSLCPRYRVLQGQVSDEWGGTCAIFSMWYALLRLLNPSVKPETVTANMSWFLRQGNPNNIIRQITRVFTSLITLNVNTGQVNNGFQEINSKTHDKIKARLKENNLFNEKRQTAIRLGGWKGKKTTLKRKFKQKQSKINRKIKTSRVQNKTLKNSFFMGY
jgi:hypothetical protein